LPRQAQSQVRNSTPERWRVISPLSAAANFSTRHFAAQRSRLTAAEAYHHEAEFFMDRVFDDQQIAALINPVFLFSYQFSEIGW
jgi:hypothetical protein